MGHSNDLTLETCSWNRMMRHVILHYHLFKNAGTSLDQILKHNFAGRWETAEFPSNRANTAQVSDWIMDNPNSVCFSSHTMLGPLPEISGVRVVPILLLRDPIARIASAYRFERAQAADTFGANLAKQRDFAGYVHTRLATQGDGQCRNFQTSRLASMYPGTESEAKRARQATALIQHQGVLGLVAQFDHALGTLAKKIAGPYPDFTWRTTRINISTSREPQQLKPDLHDLLSTTNAEDIALLDFAKSRLRAAQYA